MKLRIALVLAAVSLPGLAEEKSFIDKVNENLESARQSIKSGAKKAEKNTNDALDKARPKVKAGAKKAEQDTNDALHRARKKVGTEK
jgi:hypothetical protein